MILDARFMEDDTADDWADDDGRGRRMAKPMLRRTVDFSRQRRRRDIPLGIRGRGSKRTINHSFRCGKLR